MFNESASLKTKSLEVWRGGVCLFEGLDFTLEAGQVAIVSGANGCGKTTLLRILSGINQAAGGYVTWRGEKIHRLNAEAQAEIAYQGHLDGLKKEFTVLENLRFYQTMSNQKKPLASLLEELRLGPYQNRKIRNLYLMKSNFPRKFQKAVVKLLRRWGSKNTFFTSLISSFF